MAAVNSIASSELDQVARDLALAASGQAKRIGAVEETRAAIRASVAAWCMPVFAALQIAGRAPVLAELFRQPAQRDR